MQSNVKHHAHANPNGQPKATGPRYFARKAAANVLSRHSDGPEEPDDVGPIPHRPCGDHANAKETHSEAERKVGLEDGQNGEDKPLNEEDLVDNQANQNAVFGQGLVDGQ